MPSTPRPTIDVIAHHEAGHVVLAYITGVHVLDGEIDLTGLNRAISPLKREHALCRAREVDLGPMTHAQYDYEEAIIAAAGIEAERLYLQAANLEIDGRALDSGAHCDLILVRELLGQGKWLEVRERALSYLQQPAIWNVVQALSSSLIRCKGRLSARLATDVIHDACIKFDVPPAQILK